MAYLRKKDNDVVLVILNVSKLERLKINVVNSWLKGKFRNVFSGMEFSFSGRRIV
jgi:hypothetical protein